MKKTKLEDNCNILKEQIKEHTNFNRARIFVIVGLIVSISKLRAVNLKKLATVLNARESKTANYRRIGRFFNEFSFDKKIIAQMLSSFLPTRLLLKPFSIFGYMSLRSYFNLKYKSNFNITKI